VDWKIACVGKWFVFVLDFDEKLLHLTAIEIARGVRPFWTVWVSLARLAGLPKAKPAVRDAIRAVAAILEVKCQRAAVLAIGGRDLDGRLVELAGFEADCPQSDALCQELCPG
jgi:hypothetical protein